MQLTQTFRPLVPEDLPWLQRCRDTAAQTFTALSPVSLVTWAETYGLSVAGDEDFFVVHSRHDNAFYAPVGNPDKCRAFLEEAAARKKSEHFVYLREADAQTLAARGWSVHFRTDLSEYITSAPRLALVSGSGSIENLRRKCRRFDKAFGSYRITPVTEDNLDSLWDISDRYLDGQEAMPADQLVLETELKHFADLNLRGIVLTMPDGREAFILGYENTPSMFTMTMTRHDLTLPPETTAVCIHRFAELLYRKYPLVNVEEDMGMDGLRRAKMLLSPVDLLKVYEVFP